MPVSVIIPTLNEAALLGEAVRRLRGQRPHEIIVVDGGSTDATADVAHQADLFLQAPRGRASQMNAGAARASGNILLFLHADCILTGDALRQAEECLRRGGMVAGCFTMHVDATGPLYRWIDFVATARVRLTGIVYGDQGLFVRRATFEKLGGFPPLSFLEDVIFSRRLCRSGRMSVVPARIGVSPRRWQRTGIVRQTIRNWTLLGLAAAGVHPDRLARFYSVVR
jgi:rSAM/selenodomain-associated transferase 2